MAEPAVHPSAQRSPASRFARRLLAALAAAGVRDVVVSPGSRSQALALAAAQLERAGAMRVTVRIDERAAGFVALGMAKASGAPAAVITTSGSAVANLMPAVVEAHHAFVPLILITADRPSELHGIRANQTMNQDGMFGDWARRSVTVPAPTGHESFDEIDALATRTVASALGLQADAEPGAVGELRCGPGPVHLNVAFREPLSDADGPLTFPDLAAGASPACASASGPLLAPGSLAGPTIVIAGDGAGTQAVAVAESLGAPLLAEITSGARFGPNAITHARAVLGSDEGRQLVAAARTCVVFGHPTLSREVSTLLASGLEVHVVAPHGWEWFRPVPTARRYVGVEPADPGAEADPTWLTAWRAAEQWARDSGGSGPERAQLAREVWSASSDHDRVVFAASALIRVADEWCDARPVRAFANRGLAGIDGTISTAVGVSLAAPSGVTRLVTGDLAALHDAGGLWLAEGEDVPPLQVVVGNDRGGHIFDGLEVARPGGADVRRVVTTPHRVSFAALAEAYGWRYVRPESLAEFREALRSGAPGLIEVPLP